MNNKYGNGNNWFSRPSGDLSRVSSNKGTSSFFHTPRNDELHESIKKDVSFSNEDLLEEKAIFFVNDMTVEEMKKYVKKHTSGVRLDESLCSAGGGRIATFKKFVEMVQDGYNIVKANVINYDMIDVVYQKRLNNEKKMGGR